MSSRVVKKLIFSITLGIVSFLMLFCISSDSQVYAEEDSITTYKANSIMEWVASTKLPDGDYNIEVTGVGTSGSETTIVYPVELINYYDDVTYTKTTSLGDSSTTHKMLVVKYWKNLTVKSGVTLTAARNGNYTYKKGMYIHVVGTLTNEGTISMSARGTYNLAGEDVFLWENTDGTFEYVPAVGGAGGAKVSATSSLSRNNGKVGTAGKKRGTGGGASGGSTPYSGQTISGAGGAGTAYSGGAGGGGAYNAKTATAGSSKGGAGGAGNCGTTFTTGCGGGAGNPGGAGMGNSYQAGGLGTGGLLIIYATEYNNVGTVSSNGSKGGNAYRSGGGGSGGGSVNIFASTFIAKGTATATGGAYGVGTRSSSERSDGGTGGAGTVTYTSLVLEPEYINPTLSSLTVDKGIMQPMFDSETTSYTVGLDSEDYNVNIDAILTNDGNEITSGVGNFDIPAGSSTHNVVITSKIGVVRVYEIEFYRSPSSYEYLSGITINGEKIENFDPKTLEYTINIPYYQKTIDLGVIKGRLSQEISGIGNIEVSSGVSTHKIEVISEDGSSTKIYKLTFIREHSSKLMNLGIEDYELGQDFDKDSYEYSIEVPANILSLNVMAEAYDEEATIKTTGNGYIKGSSATITILVEEPNSESSTYIIHVRKEGAVEEQQYDFKCTGEYQKFTAPATTYYKIQLWGASGGYGRTHWTLKYRGGYGAYTEGKIYLKKDETIYIYVGCSGSNSGITTRYTGGAGGWNGGAKGGDDSNKDSAPEPGGGGGGATDIRLVKTSSKTTWNEFDSLKSRIMVAAGAGGGNFSGIGGAGGTINGTTGYGSKSIPTQTAGYAFGYGMAGGSCTDGSGGAGSGYFGGYTGTGCGRGGGGGSSFVSGCENCVAIKEESISSKIVSSDSNIHYSGYSFEDITMLSGDESMPSPSGGYQTGNNGDGYAIITVEKNKSANNFLNDLSTDKGVLSPKFDMETESYNLKLGSEDDEITITAKLEDDMATLSGIGTFNVPAGTTEFPVVVTAENGDVKTYVITTTREKSSNAVPNNIIISGLVPSLCTVNSAYCKLDQGFDPDVHTYTMTVPSRIKQLQFTVQKGHYYQEVIGDGVVSLQSGMNVITIEIKSEDGTNISTYTYNIDRDMTGNASIEKLEVIEPEVDINFDPDITEYYLTVPNAYTNVSLDIVMEDENATYEVVGNENFETGLNIVTINTTAANGETKIYTLNIYREQSGNTFLNEIEVKNGENSYELVPKYNKIISNYTVDVPYEVDEVTISATAEHQLTTISGLGDKSLTTGTNTFSIISTSEDGSVQTYIISVVRAKSNDATLKSLDVLEASLSPEFSSDVEEYSLEVNPGVTSLNINPVVNNDGATYKIVGNSGFTVGNNVVKILVTAEAGNTKTYILNVNRIASSNNYLSYLNTNEYELGEFDKEVSTYDIIVPNDVSSIKVSAIKEDVLAKLSGTGVYNLKTGNNEINVMVTAENGDTRIYTLNVFREYSSNNYLMSIDTNTSEELVPEFNKEQIVYDITVVNEVREITILGVAEDKTATVSGNGTYSLVVGKNTIDLVVTAEDESIKTYTVNVVRKESSNANISSLIAKESVLDPNFDPSITSYTLKVLEKVTSLDLTIKLENLAASYEVLGNENFEIGNNEVVIKVTAEDGTVKDYILNVIRQQEGTTSNKIESLTVDNGSLSPEFSSDVMYYEVVVPYAISTITLDGELEDKNATVTGLGKYNLEVGQNILAVKVTSTEDVLRTYQVVVTRKENDEARLSNLKVTDSTLDPTFNKDTYTYSLTTTVSSLEITATPIDVDATYEVIGNSDLALGSNVVIVRVTAKDQKSTKDYTLNVTREVSNNNNLKLLEIDGVTYSPEFSKTTTVYYATVERDVNTVQITAVAEDIHATVTGDGEVELAVGTNYVEIAVESESGKTKIYTVIITRTPNDNSLLDSLTVNEGILSPTFDSNTNDYEVVVPYEVENITVAGTLVDENATVVGFDKYNLEVGQNKMEISVTSEAGTVNIYTITVIREEIVSSKLKSLSMTNYKLEEDFSQNLYDYSVKIDYEITFLDLNIETLDKNATYEVLGNSDFIVGMNTVEIVVTDSKQLTTSTYTLNVNRQSYSNTFLNYIYVTEGEMTPDFDKTNLTYTVTVENDITSVEVLAEAEVDTNTVTGIGVYDLDPGENEVAIKVATQSGITRTYYVNIVRGLKTNNNLTSLQVKANGEVQTLDPTFDSKTLDYTVEVPVGTANVQIIAAAEDGATIDGIGQREIVVGENKLPITVTSESGDTKTYTLTVIREASENNFLANLEPSIGSLEPTFSYYVDEYNLKLDSTASLLSFNVTTDDRYSTVTGNEIEIVPDGESTREIIVTAENGDTKTYTIHVFKDRTDEARLSNLEISGYSFNEVFDKDKFNYTVTVPNDKKTLLSSEVIATPVDANATVEKTSSISLSSSVINNYLVIVTAQDGFTKQTYTISIEREKGSEALLSKLEFNTGTLSPGFNAKITDYTLTVENSVSEILASDVVAVATDDSAVVTKMEKLILSEDDLYQVTVTSGDGSNSTTYNVNVVFLKSNDARLKSLTVSEGEFDPVFDKDTYQYTVNVKDTVNELIIDAVTNDDNSIILSGTGVKELTEDDMDFNITIQAEDGTIKIYTLNVLKSITTQKLLSDISLSGDCFEGSCTLNPNFSEEQLEYAVTVENEVEKVNIDVVKKHENQIVRFYNGKTGEEISNIDYTLKIGKNYIRIEVENGVGEKTNYELVIDRKLSSNTYLSNLKVTNIEDIDLDFDKNTLEYFITIPYSYDKVVFDYKTEVSTSVVDVNGATYLSVGNNDVFVTVTAENGSIRQYIVHVCRESESNYYLQSLTISSGVIYDLSPDFNKTTFDYLVTVPSEIETISFEAIAEDETTIVSGLGEKTIKTGINSFTITTTTTTGETANYNVIVNRLKSTKLYLKTLEPLNGTLNETFNKEKFSYTMNVAANVSSVDLNVVPEDSTVTYKIMGNNNLITGENNILIVLENVDKTVTTIYKLVVTKEKSTDNLLKSLKVGDEELITTENYYNTSFDVVVPYTSDSVNIEGIANSFYSTVTGDGIYSLDYGNNLVEVTVTSESLVDRIYKINIKREYDNNLLMISTDRGDLTPTFDKDTLDYYLEVEKEIDNITVIGVQSSTMTTLTGNGYYRLVVGENIIPLVISASDETSKTYTLHITRKTSSNNNLSSLYVHEGVLNEEFDKDTLEYSLEVPDTVNKLTIDAELEDSSSSYEIVGNENLVNGKNTVLINVEAENGDIKTYTLNVMVQDAATFSNRLKSLTVNKGTLSPVFDPDTLSYTVTVSKAVSSITLSGILESVDATVVGLGTHQLDSGRNYLPITVTSKDNKTRTYSVIVYQIESSDPRLKLVSFDEGTLSPLFDKDVENYKVTVDSSVYKLTEKIVPFIEGTTYEIMGNESLQTGTTTITIVATAEDKITTKTYTFEVTKEKSTNNYLENLSINMGMLSPEFDKTNTGPYVINVDDTINSIVLSGKAESSTSTVTGLGVHNIVKGKNTITVSVTSEVGSVRAYTVIVNKSLSSDNSLSFLGISDGNLEPEFDSDTLEYNVDVDSLVEEITILGIANDKSATVSGNGNYTLIDTLTKISLTVTAEDGSIREYVINVNKKIEASSKLLDIKVKEGVLSPEFDKNTYEYTVSVPNEVTGLNLDITKEDESATYEIVGNNGFVVGNNQVMINVESVDGKTSTYTLNVIRQQNSNNYLKEITLSEGSLSPVFDRATIYYEVSVDSSVSNIVVNSIAEDSNATIVGNGSKDLVVGDNYIYLEVTSATGVVRVYTIKVTKKKSSDNLLSSLSINHGTLKPNFEPTINSYTLDLSEGINSISISATADSKATITGIGDYVVETGENTYTITVTAEDGSINTYTIVATKESSSNNNITNIIPSSGVLSPNYSNDISNYEVIVEEDVSIIDFEVLLESSLAKVSGNEDIYLDYGNNEVVIKAEAEDSSVREVHINVIRQKNITDIIVDEDNILMAVGENYQLNPTVLPEDVTNKELVYEISNEEIATVEDGLIVAKEIGNVQITISSAKNANIKKTVNVTVLNLQLESTVYEVKRSDINIVIGAEEGENLSTFLSNMDNNETLIKFYDIDANQITDLENTRVASGQLITLEYNNKIYDQAWIVVRGDSSCDSNINVTDYNILVEQVLGKRNLEGYLFSSVDLEEDQIIDVTDSIKLKNYILGKIDSLNKFSSQE